jgi:hypothetical protein
VYADAQAAIVAHAHLRAVFARGADPRADPLVRGRRLVGLLGRLSRLGERVQGDPRGPGGPPHFYWMGCEQKESCYRKPISSFTFSIQL